MMRGYGFPVSEEGHLTQFEDAVAAIVLRLAPGEVVTYGDVASEAGYPGAARAVGTFLARSALELPWWRVVTATGRMVPGSEVEQARRLALEGVPLRPDTVAPRRAVARGGSTTGAPTVSR